MAVPVGRYYYESHFGEHRPRCEGRCMIAHVDTWPFPGQNGIGCKNLILISIAMVTVPTVFWLIFLAPNLWTMVSPWLPLVGVLLYVVVMIYLTLAWATEPGIVHVLTHNGQKWYIQCRGSVPAQEYELIDFRAKFCRETGNCIENFDHFCPWVGNAVGIRNYRYFVLFVGNVNLLAVYIFTTSIIYIVLQVAATRPNESVPSFMLFAWDSLPALILVAYAFVILLTVCGLFGYHISLIMKAQTTNEDLKKVYANTKNPYDEGCAKNCFNFMCKAPRGPAIVAAHGKDSMDASKSLLSNNLVDGSEQCARLVLQQKRNKMLAA
eukprot:SAG31_NODE_2564_length_5468_cov_78.362316_1_plen_323_part_00